MKITFLGTGSSMGIPVIGCNCQVCRSTDPRDKRLRSSVLVQDNNTIILIDASPDFRYQALKYFNTNRIDAVLITHAHRDHVAGLDDLRPFMFLHQKEPIKIFAESKTIESIKQLFYYSFEENPYPGSPIFSLNTIDLTPFYINDIKIIPIRVIHGSWEILGFRIGDFTYITDANKIPESEIVKITGTKVLVVNALRRKEHYAHFSLSQAVDFIKRISPNMGFITHMAHRIGKHQDLEKELPENIKPAYDGLTLYI